MLTALLCGHVQVKEYLNEFFLQLINVFLHMQQVLKQHHKIHLQQSLHHLNVTIFYHKKDYVYLRSLLVSILYAQLSKKVFFLIYHIFLKLDLSVMQQGQNFYHQYQVYEDSCTTLNFVCFLLKLQVLSLFECYLSQYQIIKNLQDDEVV